MTELRKVDIDGQIYGILTTSYTALAAIREE